MFMKNMSHYTLLAGLLVLASPFALHAKPMKKSSSSKAAKHAYLEVTSEQEFATEVSKKAVSVVKFHAPSCGWCKKMEPQFEQAAETLKNDAAFLSVNTSAPEVQDIARTFNVTGLPTTLIISRKTGFMTAEELEKEVSKATGKAAAPKAAAAPAPMEKAAPAAPAKKAVKKS